VYYPNFLSSFEAFRLEQSWTGFLKPPSLFFADHRFPTGSSSLFFSWWSFLNTPGDSTSRTHLSSISLSMCPPLLSFSPLFTEYLKGPLWKWTLKYTPPYRFPPPPLVTACLTYPPGCSKSARNTTLSPHPMYESNLFPSLPLPHILPHLFFERLEHIRILNHYPPNPLLTGNSSDFFSPFVLFPQMVFMLRPNPTFSQRVREPPFLFSFLPSPLLLPSLKLLEPPSLRTERPFGALRVPSTFILIGYIPLSHLPIFSNILV